MNDDEIHHLIGTRLRARRVELGLTLQELARKTGVRAVRLNGYETAQTKITASMLWRLAQALGSEVAHFFRASGTVHAFPVAPAPRTWSSPASKLTPPTALRSTNGSGRA